MSTSVLWAIDPFDSETRPTPTVLRRFFHWMKALGYTVQPVHTLSLSSTDQINSAEKLLRYYLAESGVTDALPPKALPSPQFRGAEVRSLLDFAERTHAPLIAVSSHGRSGLGRLIAGSFAESLLLESKIPIFFLTHEPPQVLAANPIRKILFPTDFSGRSRVAFQKLLPHAKTLGAEIILFHAVAIPSAVFAPAGMYGAADTGIPEGYFENMELWAEQESEHWVREAKDRGVAIQVIIKDEGVSSQIARSILMTAREEKVDLIAMASLSGAFTSFVAGSVAREVFRSLEYPVWVCGPKASASDEPYAEPGPPQKTG